MGLLYGRAGRSTALFGGFRPGQGHFEGVPSLGVQIQPSENPFMKAKYGIGDSRQGVLVTKVVDLSSAADVLKAGDVIQTVDGKALGEDGSVPFRGYERISFVHFVTQRRPGQPLAITVQRAGESLALSLDLVAAPKLVPRLDGVDARPQYLIVGGLVCGGALAPLRVPLYTRSLGNCDIPSVGTSEVAPGVRAAERALPDAPLRLAQVLAAAGAPQVAARAADGGVGPGRRAGQSACGRP
jgi:hypothetical protein